MNKKIVLISFVCVQLGLILVQIHKSSMIAGATYQRQYLERTKKELEHRKQELTYQINAAKSKTEIKAYASGTLGMQPIALHQIKKLDS